METLKLNKVIYDYMRPLFLALCFLSVFKGVFGWLFKTTVFEYLDELIFLMAIVILSPIYLLNVKQRPIYFFIFLFTTYSILVSLIFGVSGSFLSISLQTMISIKFFVILLAMIELFKNNFQVLDRFFLNTVGFAFAGLVIHFILGTKFNEWTGISTFARPNVRYVGFFTHPNHLAYLVVLYAAYMINKRYSYGLNLRLKDWLKLVLGFIVIILADSRTAMLSVGVLLFSFFWPLIKKNAKLILSVLTISLIALMYVYIYTNLLDSIIENIHDTLDLNSHYIRGNMIYLSGVIFIDYFPIGTGAATFGSLLSDNTVYGLYGQANRYYFANEIGIYDSNIASIIGEYGFIGVLFFICLFYYLYKYLKSFTQKKTLVAPMFFIFLIYSITNPMLTNNVYTLLSSLILILLVSQPFKNSIVKQSI